MQLNPCPLCDSQKTQFAFVMNYWREFPLQFFDCHDCAAVFASPMPSDRVITDGNDALVRYLQQHREFEHDFRDARQAYLRGKLLAKKCMKKMRRGRLLELGCYNGFFSLGFKDNSDWEVEGLEISDLLSEFVFKTLGIRCHSGTLEQLALPDESYDFIVCHDLIEHINQPKKFLFELTRILRKRGLIQIITPNSLQDLAFARRAFKAGKSMTMLLNHILLFSPKTLKLAMERAGLTIEKLYCYDVRYAFKDFGLFGLGQPHDIPEGPLMAEALALEKRNHLLKWTPEVLNQLRTHPKTSLSYGYFKEVLPQFLSLKVPPRVGIGHEIYTLARKDP